MTGDRREGDLADVDAPVFPPYVPWTGDTTALILRPCAALVLYVPPEPEPEHLYFESGPEDRDKLRMVWWIPTAVGEVAIDAAKFPKAPSKNAKVPAKDRLKLAGEVATALLAGDDDGTERLIFPTPDYPQAGNRARAMIEDVAWGVLRKICAGAADFALHATAIITDLLLAPPDPDSSGVSQDDQDDDAAAAGTGDGELTPQEIDPKGVQELLDAIRAEIEKLGQMKEALNAVASGLDRVPQLNGADGAARTALAERVLQNPNLRRILDLAGRIASSAWNNRQERSPVAREEVVDIMRGDELPRALPQQLMLLADPVLRMLAVKDWADSALLQYELVGSEPVRKGPIVVIVDNSGSMGDQVSPGMTRIDVAAAVTIGCIRTAHAQKRDVHLAGFNSQVTWFASVLKKTPPEDTAQVVMHVASLSPGGGTDFSPPVDYALNKIKEGLKADIVIVTDGEGALNEGTTARLNAARRAGLYVFALTIGNARPGLPADRVIPIDLEREMITFGEELGKRG